MGVRLPSTYQEVEYLESTGSQYINTRINVRSGLKTIAKVELTSVDRVQYICGGYTASPRVYFSPFYCRSNNTVGCAYNTTEFPSNYAVTAETPYFIESILSNGTQSLKINGELAISGQVEGAFEANWPIWIFANNNSNGSYRRFAFAKISLFELIDSDSNEVIRKFIPCYRKSDNEPGMYDLVSGEFFTNAGTGEFLVGADVIDSISPWLVARRRWIMAAASRLIKRIATGVNGVVNFITKVKKPMKVTCEFSPVQAGTGDPSPSNVRPISGWTGCEITHTGKNLLSPDDTGYGNYTIGSTGNHITGGYARLSSGFIPVSKGDVLTLGTWITLYKNVGFGFAGIAIYDKDKQFVRREFKNYTWSITATIGEGEKYIRAFSQFEPESESAILTPSVWSRYKIQLERASSRTTYESYTGSTLPITFTDPDTGDPMTVYGGTVTLNEDGSADLVQTMAMRNASQLGFARFSSTYADPDNNIYGPALSVGSLFKDSGRVETAYSNVAKSGVGKTGHNFQIAGLFYLSIYSPTPLTTGAETLAYLESIGFYVVGTLNKPVTYHFDNIGQLQSFLGTNNIWHNMNGSITAEYYKKQ